MKALLLGAFLLVASVVPAAASSVTIDSSTGCSNCYGLTWTLTVNTGSYQSGAYTYEAILSVTDDPLIGGTPTDVISAVDFKVSSSVTGATLYTAPGGAGTWTTLLAGTASGGCTTSGSGFVCSQSATAAPYSPLRTWGWYFNTNDPIFSGLNGAHIGAKMVPLGTPGKLLSETAQVPEPTSLSLIGAGALGLATVLARRRRRSAKS